ncbi:MAG: hypothetical protein JJT96_10895 [Opitutales bacterium]|nr:hypothetical protein [Opitutales bacterium]
MKDRTESIKLTDGQLADEHASLDRAISKAKRARERLELSRKKMLALDLIEDTRKGVMDRHPPCPVEEIEELQIDHRMALDREEAFDEAVKRLERDRAASDGKEDPVVEDDLSLDSPAVERQRESRVSDEDLQKL